jgi:eukaryotic-like serine/threonine-protein kinase
VKLNPEQFREIFSQALEKKSPAERESYLAHACQGDPELRQQVESLLRAHEQAGEFLGQSVKLPPPNFVTERAGTMIGRYKLLELIGEGGFGTVWMAEQEEPVRRRVALKIIKPGMDTKQVLARFEAERQALAMMEHPSIARVLDAGATDTGRPYFVMELVRGTRITEHHGLLRRKQTPDAPTAGVVHPGLPGGATRPSKGHHSSRPQAVEYTCHGSGRRARAQSY